MAADAKASGSGDFEVLQRRLDELDAKFDAVSAANATNKTMSRIVAVVIVIAAVFGVYLIVSPFLKAWQDRESYVVAMETEFKERILPALQVEVEESMKSVGPEVTDLVVKRLQERQEDVVRAIDLESGILMNNLQTYLETTLADNVVEIEMEMKKRLNEMVPEMQDETKREEILAAAVGAVENAVNRSVEEHLGSHIESLVSIETQIHQVEVPTSIKEMSESELADEMNRALAEYAILILRQVLTPETKEMLRDLGEDNS